MWLQLYGCTDADAANFDPTATIDDETCIYELEIDSTVTVMDVTCAGDMNGSICGRIDGGIGSVNYALEGGVFGTLSSISSTVAPTRSSRWTP